MPPNLQCPVCAGKNHHTFWYWDNEDSLMRKWAADCRIQFQICRDCAAIFQQSLNETESSPEIPFFEGFADELVRSSHHEPFEWLKQFANIGKQPCKALEIYAVQHRFSDALKEQGWEIHAVPYESLLADGQPPAETLAGGSFAADDRYDLIFCFDVLSRTPAVVELMSAIHDRLTDTGVLYLEAINPVLLPRIDRMYLTSEQQCLMPFETMIFLFHKTGFINRGAELCGKARCFLSKSEPHPEADPTQLLEKRLWEYTLFRFQRNFYWVWAADFLRKYLQEQSRIPNCLEQTRAALAKRPGELQILRDVCGAVLLFVQEVDTLRATLASDWKATMQRIFDILKQDFAMFELLRTASPIQGLGTMPDIERYYFNEKMIFMTNHDYFDRFFSETEAAQLCAGIVRSGEIVCKTFSSFL